MRKRFLQNKKNRYKMADGRLMCETATQHALLMPMSIMFTSAVLSYQ